LVQYQQILVKRIVLIIWSGQVYIFLYSVLIFLFYQPVDNINLGLTTLFFHFFHCTARILSDVAVVCFFYLTFVYSSDYDIVIKEFIALCCTAAASCSLLAPESVGNCVVVVVVLRRRNLCRCFLNLTRRRPPPDLIPTSSRLFCTGDLPDVEASLLSIILCRIYTTQT